MNIQRSTSNRKLITMLAPFRLNSSLLSLQMKFEHRSRTPACGTITTTTTKPIVNNSLEFYIPLYWTVYYIYLFYLLCLPVNGIRCVYMCGAGFHSISSVKIVRVERKKKKTTKMRDLNSNKCRMHQSEFWFAVSKHLYLFMKENK